MCLLMFISLLIEGLKVLDGVAGKHAILVGSLCEPFFACLCDKLVKNWHTITMDKMKILMA